MRKVLILTLLATALAATGCGWHRYWAGRAGYYQPYAPYSPYQQCEPYGDPAGGYIYEGPAAPPPGYVPGPVYDGAAG